MSNIAVLRTFEQWGQLRASWQRLLDESANRSPFMTWEWLDAWCRQFTDDRELQILVCSEGDDVTAIVPLVTTVRKRSKVEVRTTKLLGNGLSDQLGLLVRPGCEDTMARIARCFGDGRVEWDHLALEDLDFEDPLARKLEAELVRVGIPARFDATVQCPYVRISTDWETFYTQQIGKKTRATNRSKLRKLDAMGEMRFRWVLDPGEVGPALERVRAMDERSAYHGEERIRPFDSERGGRFFLDFGTRFAEQGWLLLGLLEVDEAVVAYRYSFRFGGRHFDFFPGFRPDLFKLSVGRLLMAEIMKKCFEEGVEEVNFLRGFESWKEEWTGLSRSNAALTACNPSVGSRGRTLLQKIPWF